MAKQTSRQVWVDRYVREELAVDETVEFEQALMESSAMQQDLETALGLREALLFEPEQSLPRTIPWTGEVCFPCWKGRMSWTEKPSSGIFLPTWSPTRD